jgi:hypothetical protein
MDVRESPGFIGFLEQQICFANILYFIPRSAKYQKVLANFIID